MGRRSMFPKRVGRLLTSRLHWRTKAGLLRAEFGRGRRDVAVPIGSTTAWVLAATDRVDYFTLYGSIMDRHFSSDVDGATVLDVGAHKGYYAMRELAGGAASVHSYEPASQNLEALRRSAADVSRWKVHPVAVGASSGSVELNLSAGSWGHSIHTPIGGESVRSEHVDVVALSDVLAEVSAEGNPVVVKINVEGAAGEMILGTDPTDWSAVRDIWVDVEANDPVSRDELAEFVATCGFTHCVRDGKRSRFSRW